MRSFPHAAPPFPLLSYELLHRFTTRGCRQALASISVDYYALWSPYLQDEVVHELKTLNLQASVTITIVGQYVGLKAPLNLATSYRVCGTHGLTILGSIISEMLLKRHIWINVKSQNDVQAVHTGIQLLSRIAAQCNLVLTAYNLPHQFISTLLRMDICSHLAIEGLSQTPLMLAYIRCAKKLRVLSLGSMPSGIPLDIRKACEDNRSLCYAGAYGDSTINVANGLVPYPYCWTPSHFNVSIIPTHDNITVQTSFERVCNHMNELASNIGLQWNAIHPRITTDHDKLIDTYASMVFCNRAEAELSFHGPRRLSTVHLYSTCSAYTRTIQSGPHHMLS